MKALATSVLLVVALGAAEVRADTAWTVGCKGGVSLATAGGDDAGDAGSRTAFAGGGFVQADFAENFGLRFEGLYFMKGVTDAISNNADFSLQLDYVEFPVLLVGQAPLSKVATLSVFAGPSFSINASSAIEIDFGDFGYSAAVDQDIKDFDFGLTFGTGVNVQAGSVVIVLDARYDLGLKNFDEGLDSPDELDLNNQAWAFMAGVGFPIR